MYSTQCVPFEGCNFEIPISLENGSSPKFILTSFGDLMKQLDKFL